MVQIHHQRPSSPLPRAKLPDQVVQRLATITLGRPSADCRHFGICRIELSTADSVFSPDFVGQQSSGCGSRVAALVSYRPPDFLELAIVTSTVSAAIFKQHFSQGCFLLEENYWLPFEIFERAMMLPAGCYNIEITDTLLLIRLPGIS